MTDAMLMAVEKMLWTTEAYDQEICVHWLLDGARNPRIAPLVKSSGLLYSCLFSGDLHPRLQAAAPYLVKLHPGLQGTTDLLREGWGQAWGIFTISDSEVSHAQQRLHLKKFLRVKTEQGETLAFRYYDPRVLNVYLPSCTPDETRTFLGPQTALIAESDDGAIARKYQLRENTLAIQQYAITST